jgi:hypothetical protein
LPLEMIIALTRETGRLLSAQAPREWRWRDRCVKASAVISYKKSRFHRQGLRGNQGFGTSYRHLLALRMCSAWLRNTHDCEA